MDISPMVTMITEMIGSPIRRLKKIRSTLMARKKVMTMLSRKDSTMWISTHTASA